MKDTIIDSSNPNSFFALSDILYDEISNVLNMSIPLVVLCIGTDRATGDCLGPIVGEKLKFLSGKGINVYGNLQNPIHAKNICDFLNHLNSKFDNPYIIAIDACLGSIQNVGKIIVGNKPICPGSALNKSLPSVGNLSITGVVNISGAFEFMVLQNTRLCTVMKLADTISKSIYHSFIKAKSINHVNTLNSSSKLINDLK